MYVEKTVRQSAKIANAPIVCYKVFFLDSKDNLYSPFDMQKWGSLKDCLGKRFDNNIELTERELDNGATSNGFFYSYPYQYKPITDAMSLNQRVSKPNYKVFECEIPAGSVYLEGLDIEMIRGYASRSLIIKSEIDVSFC